MDYLWFLIGVITGSIITIIYTRIRSAFGVFRIDKSNPEKDVYRLDVGDLDNLSKKKQLILKIDKHSDLSQK